MTEIYFVRHAESTGNMTGRAYGWYDGLVSLHGYEQIKCLEKRFEDIEVDAIYSSDLIRAVKTAEAIYKPKGLVLNKDVALREINLGAWENKKWEELPSAFPEEHRLWTSDPLNFKVEGSETYHEVYTRMRNTVERIVGENEGKTVVIVGHGVALRMLIYGVLNNGDLSGIVDFDWGDNTSVSHFVANGGELTLDFINDNSHLKDLPGFKKSTVWGSTRECVLL
ncbi:MAG: histidine phosphatase family protein [Oscillospiraceae bacterium]|nr:histidine phosphatase family protein [Oscillospiraceae bacterium]